MRESEGLRGNLGDKLYADSKAGKVFTGLMPLITSNDNIRLAYRNIKRNHGSKTAGVDGMTIRDIEKLPEEEVIHAVQIKLQWYQPKAVKWVDHVNHTKLIQQMWSMGLRDKTLICIIKEMLKAPIVLPDGGIENPCKGTPQGGILSPLLSNIVLNELDWWVSSQWERMPAHDVQDSTNVSGGAKRSHAFRAFRNSGLKEMQIVRYADDFKIFCRTRADAEKVFIAVKRWLQERLKLEINEEKSSVVNLKKRYSEFLGFKFKAVKRRHTWVVRSHMSDKAIRRSAEKLKEQIKLIARPKNVDDERYMIHLYNAMVRGLHEYFEIATCVSLDFTQINRSIFVTMINRLGKRLKKRGEYGKRYTDIQKRYGSSKQVRFVSGRPITPVGYIRTRHPMWKKRAINKYTAEGREAIHKPLGINTTILEAVRCESGFGKIIEYLNNRISRYCGQYGKCAVTENPLEVGSMHCHHVVPKQFGGTDAYDNLVWFCSTAHQLIHATQRATICKYLEALSLTPKQIAKVNKYRKHAQLPGITNAA